MTATITAPGQTWEIRRNAFPNSANQGTVSAGLVPGLNAYQTGSPAGSYGGVSGGWQQFTVTSLPAGSRFGVRVTAITPPQPAGIVRIQLRHQTELPAALKGVVYVDATTDAGNIHLGSGPLTGLTGLTFTSTTPVTEIRIYCWLESAAGNWTGNFSTGLAWWCVEFDPTTAGPPFNAAWGVYPTAVPDSSVSWAGTPGNSPTILTGPATLTVDDVLTARLDRDTGIVEVSGQFVRRSSTPTRLAGRVQFLCATAAAAADLARLYQQFDTSMRITTDVPGHPLNRLLHRATGQISTQSERTVPGRPARWSVTVDIQET